MRFRKKWQCTWIILGLITRYFVKDIDYSGE
jgi:hypothetical protein